MLGFRCECPTIPHIQYMGVSKNSGTPKSSILIGFSIKNHPFWGTPIFGNNHIFNVVLNFSLFSSGSWRRIYIDAIDWCGITFFAGERCGRCGFQQRRHGDGDGWNTLLLLLAMSQMIHNIVSETCCPPQTITNTSTTSTSTSTSTILILISILIIIIINILIIISIPSSSFS